MKGFLSLKSFCAIFLMLFFFSCSTEHDYSGNWRVVKKILIKEESSEQDIGEMVGLANTYSFGYQGNNLYRILFATENTKDVNYNKLLNDAKNNINWDEYEGFIIGMPYLFKIKETHYQAFYFIRHPDFGGISKDCVKGEIVFLDLKFSKNNTAEGFLQLNTHFFSNCEKQKNELMKNYGQTNFTKKYAIELELIQ